MGLNGFLVPRMHSNRSEAIESLTLSTNNDPPRKLDSSLPSKCWKSSNQEYNSSSKLLVLGIGDGRKQYTHPRIFRS